MVGVISTEITCVASVGASAMVVVVVVEQWWWLIWYGHQIGHWSAVKNQVLDIEHQVDPKITGDVELVGIGIKPPQYPVRTHTSSRELLQSSRWEPLWTHSDHHLISNSKLLQTSYVNLQQTYTYHC